MPKLAAIGTGAMGWAVRALMMGWDVVAYAVDPAARGFETARAQLPALYDVALPPEGQLSHAADLAEAVRDVALVIHSVDDVRFLYQIQKKTAQGTPVLSVMGELCLMEARKNSPAPEALLGFHHFGWLMPVAGLDASDEMFDRVRPMLSSMGVDLLRGVPCPLPHWAGAEDGPAVISVLRALKARKTGIGAFLAEHERQLAPPAPAELDPPPVTLARQVPPDWVDYNGHMNEARYLTAFSDATDRLLLWAGMDADCIASGHSVFTVETHICHLSEVDIGDFIEVRTRVVAGGGKRLHLWHELSRGDALAATAEQLLLHIDLTTRRVGPPRADIGAWLEAAQAAQADRPLPGGFGRFVGAPR